MKKFLSLVLALIMTMSLVTISAGATEYKDLTDKDEIEYEEAVAVLNRIGVITGYEDGSFRPETELTRGAAAKIIVSLLIGPEAASNLPNATAPYPDVPASHTFAGVISYCKTAKIISGYGDGTFKPGNSLTGFAFAKMLLGALGYSSEIEGFVDTGWTMNVAKVGNVAGLFDRLDFDGAGAVNRETACQLALNTLKATMVTYGGTTMVTGAQTLAVANTQAMYKTSNNREINANINRRVISAQNNELTLEFGEEHFKDLRLEHDKYDPAYDNYGRPSDEWSWKKVTVGTFPLPADFTFTTQMAHREDTVASKEKALGLRNYDTYSTDHRAAGTNWSSPSNAGGWNSPFADATQITIDGWDARVLNSSYAQTPAPARSQQDTHAMQNGNLYSYNAFSITAANRAQAPSIAEICDLTDNGVTVEVYVCPVDADFITNVVVTRTQLMKVDRLGSDFVTLDRISPDSRDPRRTPTDGLRKITGYNAFSVDYEVEDVKDDNFDAYETLKGLKVGDYVAVVPYTADQGQTYEVGEAYVPETVSGSLSDVGLYMNTNWPEGNATSITIGGTRYVINEWNLDMLSVKKGQINSTRKDVTGYLAKDGTILWATEIGNSDDWMIVGDYYQAANTSGKVVWFVHGWTIGNEEVDLDLGTIRQEAEIYAPGELVHYELATGGTGEYVLGKPNDTGFSSWYSTDGNQEPEDVEVDGQGRRTGEGVYNVAQWVKNNGVDRAYEIHPANSMIPLEDYGNYKITSPFNTSVGGAIHGDEDAATAPHAWDYRSTTYKDNGVKFIYVNFDEGTGEVDYISVRKDAQSVENRELAFQNIYWNNVATNVTAPNQMKWVVSPAEAYVNEDGNVEAVVIKSEPTVADLSNVIVVGESVGAEIGKSTGAETTTPTNSHAREYWQGPDFSEKKTGYFKNQHNVGDIVVIRSIDDNNVMDCKMFNSGNYSDRNPDVFLAAGIKPLKSAMDKTSKIAFYVGDGNHTVLSQNRSTNLKTSGSTIMSDLKVEADDLLDLDELQGGYKGLVKVAGAKWIDLRANRGSKDVRSLSDLLDLNNDSVRITVLVNANSSHDNFRRAYAIVVTGGWDETDDAAAATVTLSAQTVATPIVPVPFTGNGTKTSPFVISMPAGTWVQLTANPTVTTGNIVAGTARWIVEGQSSLNRDGNVVMAQAPATAPVTNLTYVVNTRDDSATGNREVTKTVYVELRNSGYVDTTATITLNPSVAGVNLTVFNAAGAEIKANADGTFTLEQNTTYTVKAEGYKDATITTGKDAAQTITVTLTPEGEEPTPDTVEITATGAEGQTLTFKKAADDTVVATGKVGEAISVPAADKVYVVADDSTYYACASKGGTPYAKAFKPTSVDSIRVYEAGDTKWGTVLTSDDVAGIGQYVAEKAARALAAEDLAETSVQNAAAPAYIKFDLGEDGYVLAKGQDDFGATIYVLHEDTKADASEALTALFDVLNNGGDLNDIIKESSAEEFENGYTGEPTPVEPSETFKASIDTNHKITFASYKGEKLTEAQVLAAIKAACPLEINDASLDMAKGEVKSAAGGVTYKFDTSAIPTSYQVPTVLYKVTVAGKGDQYVATNGKLTGLGNGEMAGLMAEKTIVANAPTVAVASDGTATFTGTKDTTYVPAVKVAEVPDDHVTIEAGDAVELAANKYVQKGATLSVYNRTVNDKNISFTLTVNGVKNALKFDDKGMLTATVTFADDEEDASLLTIKYAAGMSIYVNDGAEPVVTDATIGKAYAVANPVDGSKLVVGKTNTKGVLTLSAATYDTIRGRYTVGENDVAGDGAIHLYSAWIYNPTGGAFDLGTELKADKSDFAAGKSLSASDTTFIKDGAQIFVKAKTANTKLVVDETNGEGLTLGAVQQAPSTSKSGIWALTVHGNINATSLKNSSSLATGAVTGETVRDVSHASTALPVVTEVTFAGVAQNPLPDDVEVARIYTTTVDGVVFSNAEIVASGTPSKERTGVSATVTVTKPYTAGATIDKVIIELSDGSSVEATLTAIAAKIGGTASTTVPIKAAGAGSKAKYDGTVAIDTALAEGDKFTIGNTEYTIIAADGTETTTEFKAATVTASWLATKVAAAVGTPSGFDAATASSEKVTLQKTAVGVDSNPTASAALLTGAITGTNKISITVEATAGVDATPAVMADFTGLDLGAILYTADADTGLTATTTSGGKAINVKYATGAWTLEVATTSDTVIGTGTRNADTGVITFTADDGSGLNLGTVVAPGTDAEMTTAFGSGAATGFSYTAVRT